MIKQTIYDPFTKVTPYEKSKIVKFLVRNQDSQSVSKDQITASIESAVKEVSSFGGFVLTMSEDDEILAVIVVNHTGMDAFSAAHLISYFATHREHRNVGIGRKILSNALSKLKGKVAFRIREENPELSMYKDLGFGDVSTELIVERGVKKSATPNSNTSKIA